jgi:hypothetical protein
VTCDEYLSLSWCYDHRYELSRELVDQTHVEGLVLDALVRNSLGRLPIPATFKSCDSDICQWVLNNGSIELHEYDYHSYVHKSYDPPVRITNQPDMVLLFSYNPYTCSKQAPFDVSTHTELQHKLKDSRYLAKSFFVEDVELAWLSFDNTPTFSFIHHNQLSYSATTLMVRNQQQQLQRFMVEWYLNSRSVDTPAIAFDSSSYVAFAAGNDQPPPPTGPFSSYIMEYCGFDRVTHTEIADELKLCDYIQYPNINVDDLRYWIKR